MNKKLVVVTRTHKKQGWKSDSELSLEIKAFKEGECKGPEYYEFTNAEFTQNNNGTVTVSGVAYFTDISPCNHLAGKPLKHQQEHKAVAITVLNSEITKAE
tara:strand:- start:226 stop:528 length:303 start_codon:yes stop_codon:yes gene_type:complete